VPTATATTFFPTVAVRVDLLRDPVPFIPQPPRFSINNASAIQFDLAEYQPFTLGNQQLPGGLRLLVPNPVQAGSWARTDATGNLRFKPIGAAQESPLTASPYHLGFYAPSYESNKNRVSDIAWSTDGQQFSFLIDSAPGTDNSSAGLWFWHPYDDPVHGNTVQLIRDCPVPYYRPCTFVNPLNANHWKTLDVQWSPWPGNNVMLVTLHLTGEGRNGLAIVPAVRDVHYANTGPNIIRYEFGNWNPSGAGIIVSGRRPDGRVVLAETDNNLENPRTILDGPSLGLWMGYAVRHPHGPIYFLGRPGASGPLALYDQYARQRSAFVGFAAPDSVRWLPDRNAVVLSVHGRQYSIGVPSGQIIEVTDFSRSADFDNSPPPPIPDAVIGGYGFVAGQQVRVLVPVLNLRQQPTTSSAVLRSLVAGEYVAIFAGPYDNEGYFWWRVQTAHNQFGWLAGTINGVATVQ